MNKTGQLFLLILAGLGLLAIYTAFFPLPSTTLFGRFLGLGAFFLLCISLLIGPLALFWPMRFAQWIKPRRQVGIAAFIFLGLHFLLEFMNFFNFNLFTLLNAFNSWIAIPAAVIFLALALTSTNAMVRRLGNKNWKTLHRLTYFAFAFTLIHFALSLNGWFVRANSQIFVNLAELVLLALGIVTVLFQIAGFLEKRKRNRAAAAQNQK